MSNFREGKALTAQLSSDARSLKRVWLEMVLLLIENFGFLLEARVGGQKEKM